MLTTTCPRFRELQGAVNRLDQEKSAQGNEPAFKGLTTGHDEQSVLAIGSHNLKDDDNFPSFNNIFAFSPLLPLSPQPQP